jgi:Mg-chelatase subunit ChlD
VKRREQFTLRCSVAAMAGLAVLPACALHLDAQTLHAGPAYTSKNGSDGPAFPQLDVVVRLKDAKGAPIAFNSAEMKLYSNGSEVGELDSVRSLGTAGYGVREVLALDLSGSMKGKPLDAVRQSIAQFVNQARVQDRVEVVSFANDTRIEVPFGADKQTLAHRLNAVVSRGNETHLYDAVLEAMAQLTSGPPVFRQLTVISDGHDEGSQHSIDDVTVQAKKQKIAIDAIGLTRSHSEFLSIMQRLATETGGNYAQAHSPEELSGLIDQGIEGLRATPVVEFKADKLAADGQTHPVEVRWEPRNLASGLDVTVPNVPKPRSVWGWVLGLCVAAGVTLLQVAFKPRKKQPAPALAAVPSRPQVSPPRAETAYEHAVAGLIPKPERAEAEPAQTDNSAAAAETLTPRAPARAKTVVAAFFPKDVTAALLEVTSGPLTGERLPVVDEVRIGALKGNDLVIAGDPMLSGFHGIVRLIDGVLTIEDLNSTNGTFVNGVRTQGGRKLLRPGDLVRMGRSNFTVRTG